MFNRWKKTVWTKCSTDLHRYTRPDDGNKDDSSEKITIFNSSRDQFCRFLLHSERFARLVCKKSGFLMSSLLWNPALCSSLHTVFEETGVPKWSLSSAVIFGVVFLWSFQKIRVRVRRSLSAFAFFQTFASMRRFFLFSQMLSSLSR